MFSLDQCLLTTLVRQQLVSIGTLAEAQTHELWETIS